MSSLIQTTGKWETMYDLKGERNSERQLSSTLLHQVKIVIHGRQPANTEKLHFFSQWTTAKEKYEKNNLFIGIIAKNLNENFTSEDVSRKVPIVSFFKLFFS